MTCITLSVIDVREGKGLLLSTHSLDNRTTTAYNTDVSSGLHKVRGADSCVLVEVVLAQKEVAEALQRVVRAASDLSVAQEQ